MKLLLVLSTAMLLAGDKPKISADTRAKLWRAVADLNAAELKRARAQAEIDKLQATMKVECGGDLILDQAGEPQCAPEKEKEKEK